MHLQLVGYAALASKCLVRFLPLSGRQRKRIWRRVRFAALESDADCLSDLVIGQRAGVKSIETCLRDLARGCSRHRVVAECRREVFRQTAAREGSWPP